MTTEQKLSITEAALAYMRSKKLTQADMCRLSKINAGYLSPMLKGEFKVGNTNIEKRWFVQLAKSCDFKWDKNYWAVVQTPQFMQVIDALQTAKENSSTAVIIDDSGAGKTFAVDRFCLKHPTHTFRITVSADHSKIDLINELLEVMNMDKVSRSTYTNYNYTKVSFLNRIINKLIAYKDEGYEPVIIWDEAENLRLPVFQMLKMIYDGVKGNCAMVLIGTDQLLNKMNRLKNKNRDGMPQFYRRFKAGIVQVLGKKDFVPFFQKFEINDKGLRNLLNDMCENYGELNDYLEPALKECAEKGIELTEDFFRIKFNLPKFKTA